MLPWRYMLYSDILIFIRTGKGGVPYNLKSSSFPNSCPFSLTVTILDKLNPKRRLTHPVERPTIFLIYI
jgi:hypothetical protein